MNTKYLLALLAWCLVLTPLAFADLPDAKHLLQDNAASTTVVAAIGTDGTLSGAGNTSASTYTPGPGTYLTRALTFDGTDDKVNATTGNSAVLQNKSVATIALWFKTTTGDTTGTHTLMIVGVNGGGLSRSGLFLNSSGQLLCYGRAGDGESAQVKTSTNTYDDGNWHHAAAVTDYAADTITLYVDGGSVAASGTISFTGTATANTASSNILFGGGVTNEYFKGQLADCRIYDSNESANIAAIMAEANSSSSAVVKILLQLSDARLRRQSQHFATYGVYALAP